MDRPLWQIVFNIALIGFVAKRAAFGLALQADRTPTVLWGVYVVLLVVCGFTAIAILFSRRWVIAGTLALLAVFASSTFVELAVGVGPAILLIGQLVLATALGGALVWWASRDHSATSS